MSPKHPIRPKLPGNSKEGPTGARDLAPDALPWRPPHTENPQPNQAQGQRLPETVLAPETPFPAIEITDLPDGLQISASTVEISISNYYLPQNLVDRLPAPSPETGIRSIISARQYVDLVDGGTVPLGIDPAGHLRAKQMTELLPSGPKLERVEGTLKWRRVESASLITGDSELTFTRRPLPTADEQEQSSPPKRPRQMDDEHSAEDQPAITGDNEAPFVPRISDPAPWKNWGIEAQRASPEDITIEGIRFKTLPHSHTPGYPVVYVKNPEHALYDFDLLQATLKQDVHQQPRGAIQVPPNYHWEIDPSLPFAGPLTDYVATYFPELTTHSLELVARKQFSLANGNDVATSPGLTTLRQVFNDWKTASVTPRPELADPLVMLPTMPMYPGRGASLELELPNLVNSRLLLRLEFDPQKFRELWQYFSVTQSAVDLKRFMANLLTRHGYTVFEPTTAQSHPALVFQRAGHDLVYYMTLHRVHGHKIHVPSTSRQAFRPGTLPQSIGFPALTAMQNAEATNKLIWLKGGSLISSGQPDSVFIVRSPDPRR